MTIMIKKSKACGLEVWIAIDIKTGKEITRAMTENGCRSQVLNMFNKR